MRTLFHQRCVFSGRGWGPDDVCVPAAAGGTGTGTGGQQCGLFDGGPVSCGDFPVLAWQASTFHRGT